MSIEYTKVEPVARQAFYNTFLTFWDQCWEREFQNGRSRPDTNGALASLGLPAHGTRRRHGGIQGLAASGRSGERHFPGGDDAMIPSLIAE